MVMVISQIVRLNCSVNGNPRFKITFEGGETAQTMSDAGFCYSVGNPDMRVGSKVSVIFTPAGRIRSMSPA